jgi:hypothetical protein
VREFGVVDRGRHVIGGDFDDGRAVGRNTSGSGNAVGDSSNGGENLFALLRIHGSNREPQMRFIGMMLCLVPA